MSYTKEIKANEFDQEVLKSAQPVLVDFYAPWCGPCRMMAPVLESLAAEFEGRAKIVKLNVDTAPELAARYGIRGVPTMILFKNGVIREEIVGLTNPGVLTKKLTQAA